jgi:N-hydroxyarylamine O-acetyltransferase
MILNPQIDLETYFERIGYNGPQEATLDVLNGIIGAHTRSIPFENIDVILGRNIALDPASLQRKLVDNQRGGYCFEQNGFLLLVLNRLGFDAEPLSARVRIGQTRDFTPPRTHLFTRVELDGDFWLVDVGVGGLTPTSAIRFELDLEQTTPHEPRRIIREDDVYFHQARLGSEWQDVYEFTLEGMPLIDREVANWYTCAHPQSHFRSRLLVALAGEDGKRFTLLNDEFTVRDANGQAKKHIITSPEELQHILAGHFGMHFDLESALKLFNLRDNRPEIETEKVPS